MEASPTTEMSVVLLAGLAIAFAQLVRGVTGFGSALVGVPLLALLYGPQDAIFLVCFTDFVGSFFLAWDVRRLARWKVVAMVFPAAVVGQYIGTDLLVVLPEETVSRVLAVVVGVFAILMAIRPNRPGRGERTELPQDKRILAGMSVAGLAGGLMSGLVGAGGPPIVIYFKRFFAQEFFRAQLIMIFMFSGASLLPMLWLKGAVTTSLFPTALMLLVPMIVGNRLGAWVAPKVPPVAFSRLVAGLLVGTAGLMLVS